MWGRIFSWPWAKPSVTAGLLTLELPLQGGKSERPNNLVKTARYTLLNFLFKCGAEQFRNLSNVYFLLISILALLGTTTTLFESPYSASGTLLGLVLVVGFTMAFEGYYDIKRHREDKEINNRIAFRLRPGDGHMEEIPWAELRPGDLVKVYDRSQFPADLLFVTSCAVGSKCYVETANIDGETNLKIKHVPKDLVDRCLMPDQAASIHALVTYEQPNSFLTFSGSIRVFEDSEDHSPRSARGDSVEIALDTSNLLLRGSVLRNTPWILGFVLYAGTETKVVQSSRDPPSKRSRIQKLINKIIILILLVDLIMCTVSSLVEIYGFPSNTAFYYLMQFSENTYDFPAYVANVCTFIVLYSSMLPISLLFCMTFSNFFQAMFVHWDLNMYHEETDTPAKCNTMELVQELGQVSYVFSDKTGTLTRNEMKLVGCSIDGRTFGIGNSNEESKPTSNCTIPQIFEELIRSLAESDREEEKAKLVDFLVVLSVCHTVLVDTSSGTIQYNAEGPDEEALVSAAADIGFKLVSTDNGFYEVCVDFTDAKARSMEPHGAAGVQGNESFTIVTENPQEESAAGEEDQTISGGEEIGGKCKGTLLKFEILAINHFNSTRKRMSVICRTPDGRLLLLSKGADTIMFNLAHRATSPHDEMERATLSRHLDAFANDGLRTLVMGTRELTEQEFIEWKVEFDKASCAVGEQKAELLAEVAEKIERDLNIVGASAIEDRLQDGVPETLVALREAGVKTWVLTGDKVETAINISFSARLFTPEMELVQITSDSDEENVQNLRELHALLAPKNLAEDSEKRAKGREAVNERTVGSKGTHIRSAKSTLGKAVHSTKQSVEKAGRKALHSLDASRKALNHLRYARSPSETPHSAAENFDNSERRRLSMSPSEGLSINEENSIQLGFDKSPPDTPVDLVDIESLPDQSEGETNSLNSRDRATSAPQNRRSSVDHEKKRKRSSISKLIAAISPFNEKRRRSSIDSRKDDERSMFSPAPPRSTEWRNASHPLPPGVEREDGDSRFNVQELKGTEKNLDGFEAQNMALIISGPALCGLLADEKGNLESENLLLSIAKLCSVVVACRVSPKQKALIVAMVKKGVKLDDGSSPITLAIGDGANDVAMIQEARVGVGISGHEGRQAVNSSDFAIAQFRFLQHLMLVHGRWNYRRAASMVLFVFYANILFVLTAFVYNFANKFSGSALFWVFLTTVYSYPTQIPIAVIACLNKDISRKTALEYPAMYISGRRNLHLDRASAFEYIFKSFLHAFLISSITIIWAAPLDINISAMGTTVYMACILVCVCRACLETYTWTWINVAIIIFGFTAMFIFEPIYYTADPSIYVRFGGTVLFASDSQPSYLWSAAGIVTVMCTAYDICAMYVRKEFFPSPVDVVIEIDRGYGDVGNKKSSLNKINKVFRKFAQPLAIPHNAISELFASANLKIIRRGANRSAFDYDLPEDERVRSLVRNLLQNKHHSTSTYLMQSEATPNQQTLPMSSPTQMAPNGTSRSSRPPSPRSGIEMASLSFQVEPAEVKFSSSQLDSPRYNGLEGAPVSPQSPRGSYSSSTSTIHGDPDD